MSIHFYGAALLRSEMLEVQRRVQEYWRQLSSLHHLHIVFDGLDDEHLDESISRLWPQPGWLRFQLSATPEARTAENLLYQMGEGGAALLKQGNHGLNLRNVWRRLPQFRCLGCMLRHEDVRDAYLVIEDSTGDIVGAEDAVS